MASKKTRIKTIRISNESADYFDNYPLNRMVEEMMDLIKSGDLIYENGKLKTATKNNEEDSATKNITIKWEQYEALLGSANDVLNALKPLPDVGGNGAYRIAEGTMGIRLVEWIRNLVAINPYAIPKDIIHIKHEKAVRNGAKLKIYLAERNVSAKELAVAMGKTTSAIYAFFGSCTDESLKTLKEFVDLIDEKKKYEIPKDRAECAEEQELGFKLENAIKKWNSVSPYKIRDIKNARYKHFVARIREHKQKSFNEILMHISKSDFLQGKCEMAENHKNFKADFDWVMKPSNYIKVLEGKYDN